MFSKFHKIAFLSIVIEILIFATLSASCSQTNSRQNEAINSYNKGVRAIKADNLDLAGFYFRRAVILKPDFKEARLNLANVFFLDGNLDAAREEYMKLISEKTEDPRIYFNLGWIYLAQGEFKTAKQYFDTLQKKYPTFTDADYGLALLAKEEGEDSLVKFHLEKYLEKEPNGRWSDKARSMLPSGNGLSNIEPPAIEQEEAPVVDETQPPSDIDISSVDEKKEDIIPPKQETPGKVEKPSSSEKTKPSTPEKKEPSSKTNTPPPDTKQKVSTLIDEGFKALDKHDLKNAEKKFKEALKVNENSISAYNGLAKTCFLGRKVSDEKKYVIQMIKLGGANPNNNYDLAKGFEKIGDINSAMEHYRKYLTSNPFGPKAEEAKKRLTALDKLSGGG